MKTKTYNVYKFNELPEDAKQKAINEYITWLLESGFYKGNKAMKKAVDKAESLRTPWFAGKYIWQYAKNDVLDCLSGSDFTIDGHID